MRRARENYYTRSLTVAAPKDAATGVTEPRL